MKSDFRVSQAAAKYCWEQIAVRAGIAHFTDSGEVLWDLQIRFSYSSSRDPGNPPADVQVIPSNASELGVLLGEADGTIDWLSEKECLPANSKTRFDHRIPILFRGDDGSGFKKRFAERDRNGRVVVYVDIIAATLFMLSRWEETRGGARDQHGRFLASWSAALRHGFLEYPVIDDYATILREWIKSVRPEWRVPRREGRIRLSHDIDLFTEFNSVRHAVATATRSVLRSQEFGEAFTTLVHTFAPSTDPVCRAIETLASISADNNLQSTFFFMAAAHSEWDQGYDITDRRVRRQIDLLLQQGFEVGFHAGYHTFLNAGRLRLEKNRFESGTGLHNYGARQHYLRFEVPTTWYQLEEAGVRYDSSLTYADHEGFRCGTCYSYQPFDLERDQKLRIWEIPLIVMDTTLKKYRTMALHDAELNILGLATRCSAVGGDFTFLQHNYSIVGEWTDWGNMYRQVVPRLAEVQSANHE